MEEKTIAQEESVQIAPNQDNSNAAPAEEVKETQEAIDPRIVEIVGKENIESAYGEQPSEDPKPTEEEKKEVPPTGEPKNQDLEEKEVEVPEIKAPEFKPTRLDRRIVRLFIQNSILAGAKDEDIPSEEELLAELRKSSFEQKMEALHFHRNKKLELSGETPTGDLDEEDIEAIQETQREVIRQEVLAEEHVKQVKTNFVAFIDQHPELVAGEKEYNPALAKAVETLWRGGMDIKEAFETVTNQIQEAKQAAIEAAEAEEKKNKSAALSGVLNGSGQIPTSGKELDWDDIAKIEQEDPVLYNKMLKEGKFKHLM